MAKTARRPAAHATAGAIRTSTGMSLRCGSERKLQRELMSPFLLLNDVSETIDDRAESFRAVKLSRTEVAINHWIDIAEAWIDRYIVTPLLGPNQSAVR